MSDTIKIEQIFTPDDIETISMSSNPLLLVYETYYNYLLRATGKIVLDSNMIMAISEFHVSNLLFLKDNFTFPTMIQCKILNILALLLSLREEVKPSPTEEEFSKIKKSSTKLLGNDEAPGVPEVKEVDFSLICNQKLHQIKQAFIQSKLIKVEKKNEKSFDFWTSDYGEKPYYLKPIEVSNLMDYLNLFYFSNIKLYYHFINIEKITNNKRIDVIINKPLPVPPLHLALLQPPDKNEIAEIDTDEEKDVIKVIIH